MCSYVIAAGVAIGAAIGAGTAAATGNDPLMGAIIGGATGGFAPGSVGVFASTTAASGVGISIGSAAIATGISYAGGVAMKAMTPEPPDYSQFGQGAQPYEYSSQHAQVTGSGGRQAAAVLAQEVKRAKSLRSRQAGAEDYGLGMDMAGTGLQIA